MPALRGIRSRYENAKATRNATVSTWAGETVPATFHCSFSNVTQASVARKSSSSGRFTQHLRQLLDTRRPGELLAPRLGQRRPVQRARGPAGVQVLERGTDRRDVV